MKLKIIVGISILIFWSVATAIIVAGLLSREKNEQGRNSQPVTTPNSNDQSQNILTADVVAKHNTTSDCWLIISDKIYNVSSYLKAHPGGASTITPYCGKDGTQAFLTKDLRNPTNHSSSANNLLKDYYLGDLNQQFDNANSGVIVTPKPAIKQLPLPAQTTNQTNVLLTAAEVSKHSSSSDCWMIISGNVYNLTNYLRAHPGGAGTITPYCGKDGTQAFASRGGTGSHTNFANSLLGNYLVGTINQSIDTSAIQNTQTVTSPPSQNREEDDD